MGTLHSKLLTLHSTLYTLHSTLYTLHSTLPHSTLHTLHFTLHTLHFSLQTLDSKPFTLYAPHFTLYIPHSTLYTPHSTVYTLHSTLCTPHFTVYTPHSTWRINIAPVAQNDFRHFCRHVGINVRKCHACHAKRALQPALTPSKRRAFAASRIDMATPEGNQNIETRLLESQYEHFVRDFLTFFHSS